jgi:hypothetical protein
LCNVYPRDLDENCDREKLNNKKKKFINRVNFCGFSALHLAAQNGHNQTLRELLYAGIDTSIHNDYGDTALHTACRYGHAGVVRILISAKCDIDSFNLNHDTPLHIACAMGRRKLTKLLLEAGAMQFQNLNGDTPRDIAKKMNLKEILHIIKKIEERRVNESVPLVDDKLQQGWSPYGCHFYPDMKKFPSPKLETLPREPLQKGEQYFIDLSGKIRKGPIGRASRCACEKNQTSFCSAAQKFFNETNEKLDKRISELAKVREKLNRSGRTRKSHHRKDNEKDEDPLYSRFKIVGDRNKQIQMKSWLQKVGADIRSNSELNETCEQIKEIKKMPEYDENKKVEVIEDDDEDYSTIDEDQSDDDISLASNNENRLYDESFMRNFQHQQTFQNDSLASPSIHSNQNIELEMERIAKSLSSGLDALLVSRNPDIVQDSIHHSAKRSTRKVKSAINKPISRSASVLASGELYVNTFFTNDTKESRQSNESDDDDDDESIQLDDLISKVHKSLMNSSDVSSVSSSTRQIENEWNMKGRSRNPLPIEISELDKITGRDEIDSNEPLTTTLNENNLVLLNKLLKARKKLNQHYQQQLDLMKDPKSLDQDEIIPSSSTLV